MIIITITHVVPIYEIQQLGVTQKRKIIREFYI